MNNPIACINYAVKEKFIKKKKTRDCLEKNKKKFKKKRFSKIFLNSSLINSIIIRLLGVL